MSTSGPGSRVEDGTKIAVVYSGDCPGRRDAHWYVNPERFTEWPLSYRDQVETYFKEQRGKRMWDSYF